MRAQWTIEENWLASRCVWSPFTGMRLTGKPVRTIIRGRRVMWEASLADQAHGQPMRCESLDFG